MSNIGKWCKMSCLPTNPLANLAKWFAASISLWYEAFPSSSESHSGLPCFPDSYLGGGQGVFSRTISLLKLWGNNAWVCIVKESQTPKQTPTQVSRPDKLYTKTARWGRRWMSRSALETHTVYLTFAPESFVCRFTMFVNPRAWLWLCNSWEQPTFPGKGMKWHDVEPLVISHLLWWLRMKPSWSDRKSILSAGKWSC